MSARRLRRLVVLILAFVGGVWLMSPITTFLIDASFALTGWQHFVIAPLCSLASLGINAALVWLVAVVSYETEPPADA